MASKRNYRGEYSVEVIEEVVLGVDTHLDAHVAVALDGLGRHLGELAVPTTKKGYENLLSWADGFGQVRCAGVEGTSSLRRRTCPPPEIRGDRGARGRKAQTAPPSAQGEVRF